MKKYIIVSICLFLVSFVVGYEILDNLKLSMSEMELSIVESPNFWKLIYTNTSVCLFLILGVGIVTIPLGFYQGLQLGAMLSLWVSAGNSIVSYTLLTIPHCIFELPALIISIALGLNCCSLLIRYYNHQIISLKDPLYNLRFWVLSVAVLLFLAALVEVFITGPLYNKIMF